jgi:hypothetical protein
VVSRAWWIFFAEPGCPAWWARLLRPGFRHCYAAAYFAEQERWVEFNPSRFGTRIHVWRCEEFPQRLTQLLTETTTILRFAECEECRTTPPVAHCVGQLKALLGITSAALTPYGLYRELLARGAEAVEAPCVAAPPEAAARSAA